MAVRLIILILLFLSRPGFACEEWFANLKITKNKNCESKCRTAQTDLSSFSCLEKCDTLCKSEFIDENNNYYGLTNDEITFCKANPIDCILAYKESWRAEKICLSIYPLSDINDESDACRHFVWSILLCNSIGNKNAEIVLNAHESGTKELTAERAMDLANNRHGLLTFQKLSKQLSSEEEIKNSFKNQIKENKLIILKPNYKKSGGLP